MRRRALGVLLIIAAPVAVAIGYVNAPRPDLSKMPERRSLILAGRTWAVVSLGALGEGEPRNIEVGLRVRF